MLSRLRRSQGRAEALCALSVVRSVSVSHLERVMLRAARLRSQVGGECHARYRAGNRHGHQPGAVSPDVWDRPEHDGMRRRDIAGRIARTLARQGRTDKRQRHRDGVVSRDRGARDSRQVKSRNYFRVACHFGYRYRKRALQARQAGTPRDQSC